MKRLIVVQCASLLFIACATENTTWKDGPSFKNTLLRMGQATSVTISYDYKVDGKPITTDGLRTIKVTDKKALNQVREAFRVRHVRDVEFSVLCHLALTFEGKGESLAIVFVAPTQIQTNGQNLFLVDSAFYHKVRELICAAEGKTVDPLLDFNLTEEMDPVM